MKTTKAIMAAAAWLAAAPGAAGFGLAVSTEPVVAGDCAGAWGVTVATDRDVESSVYDMDGRLVAGPFLENWFPVPRPKTWTAETPDCYRIVAKSREGETAERIFGFRTRETKDGRLVVNGRPVRVKLAPKELNGNAVVAPDADGEGPLTNGLYAVTGRELVEIAHEVASSDPAATRHAFRDWSAAATNYFARVAVANGNSFVDSTEVELRWTLLLDGEEKDSGRLDLRGLKPGGVALYDMPEAVVAARYTGATVSVRFTFLKDGSVIAEDQTDIVASRDLRPLSGGESFFAPPPVEFEAGDDLEFSSGGFLRGGTRFVFDAAAGVPRSFAVRGAVFGGEVAKAVLPAMEGVGAADWTEAMAVSSIDDAGGGGLSVAAVVAAKFHPPYREETAFASEVAARWTVHPTGVVSCRSRSRSAHGRRLGFAFEVADADGIEWFGPGSGDTLAGRGTEGRFLARWRRDGGELRAEGVRGVRAGGLTVRTLGAPFAVRVGADDGRAFVSVFADDGEELAFTLSAGDRELTARVPDGAAAPPGFGGRGAGR